MPQTATPIVQLIADRELYTPAELAYAKRLAWALHVHAGRGDLHLAPPARPA